MVADDDGVDAVLDGEPGVLGGHDPLEHERERRPGSDRRQVGPHERRFHAWGVEQRRDVERGTAVAGGHVREVAHVRQEEPGPPVTIPIAEHGQVHGQDDRAVAGGLGPLDE